MDTAFPQAEEMRVKTMTAKYRLLTEELDALKQKIFDAVSNGKFSIVLDKWPSSDAREIMRNSGYAFESDEYVASDDEEQKLEIHVRWDGGQNCELVEE